MLTGVSKWLSAVSALQKDASNQLRVATKHAPRGRTHRQGSMLTDEASRENTQHRLSEHAVPRFVTACMPQSAILSNSVTATAIDQLQHAAQGAARGCVTFSSTRPPEPAERTSICHVHVDFRRLQAKTLCVPMAICLMLLLLLREVLHCCCLL